MLAGGADVSATDEVGRGALGHAARRGVSDTVQALLDAGVDVNAQDRDGWSALMMAANWDPVETTFGTEPYQVRSNHGETVKMLLAAGAAVNERNNEGQNALMLALEKGRQDVVELLKAAGAREEN